MLEFVFVAFRLLQMTAMLPLNLAILASFAARVLWQVCDVAVVGRRLHRHSRPRNHHLAGGSGRPLWLDQSFGDVVAE